MGEPLWTMAWSLSSSFSFGVAEFSAPVLLSSSDSFFFLNCPSWDTWPHTGVLVLPSWRAYQWRQMYLYPNLHLWDKETDLPQQGHVFIMVWGVVVYAWYWYAIKNPPLWVGGRFSEKRRKLGVQCSCKASVFSCENGNNITYVIRIK